MFKPVKPSRDNDMTQITLPMSKAFYQEIQSEAAKAGVSMKEYCRQAIDYAMNNSKGD